MSKYEALWNYIKSGDKNYDEIKNILGFEIDHSFLKLRWIDLYFVG